jgi:uncharacterized protein (TIGR03435 family)
MRMTQAGKVTSLFPVLNSYRSTIEAAGLKMDTRKLSKDTIVVDHLEKAPTEN